MASTILIFLLSLLISASADSNFIQKTCKLTKHYDLCLSSLKSNSTSASVDAKGLALIMIGVGTANATATSTYLSSQSLSSASNDTVLKRVLKECADKYSFAGDALQDSAQYLASENYDYVAVDVTAAADYPNACHNAFKRFPGLVYPPKIARRDRGLKEICDVILGILEHIAW
ncbi:hypothetical protein Pint_27227 [Pistacia integerrima]|uniref:Uncharacterized protein n=1 Tax=Pistacia integerrima TaxID=434235 RepID=A0ACC0YPE0_9ROSI|nr:hypothetical protein Pint_27227 [Pistacia integerrima]